MWIRALPWMRSLWEHYSIFPSLNMFMCLIILHISCLRKCNFIITMEQSLKSLILNRCFATIQESNNIFLASSEACYGIIISKSYGIYGLFWYHTQISCTWDLCSLMFLLLQQWLEGKRRSKSLFINWVYLIFTFWIFLWWDQLKWVIAIEAKFIIFRCTDHVWVFFISIVLKIIIFTSFGIRICKKFLPHYFICWNLALNLCGGEWHSEIDAQLLFLVQWNWCSIAKPWYQILRIDFFAC